jgi:acetoin utilization protein AcuB
MNQKYANITKQCYDNNYVKSHAFNLKGGMIMLVGERMSHPVITITPDASLQEALDLMQKEHVRRLPVVDKLGTLLGIVTKGDVLEASPSDATTLDAWEVKTMMNQVTVQRIMTTKVVTIDEDTPVEEVARVMVDKEISSMPVMCNGKMAGIITESDLFKLLLEVFGAREPGTRATVEISRTPGQLANLSRAIYDIGGNIISLGTFLGESTDVGEVILKVDGVTKEKLEEAIGPLVSRVVDMRTVSRL